MASIKSSLGDLAERAASTGWQVAAGYVIANDVFHDPTLSIPIAAALSAVKSAVVWFYGRHKPEIDKGVAAVNGAVTDYGPLVEQIVREIVVGTQTVPAAPAPTAVAPAPTPEPAPAKRIPPFMQHADQ